MTGNRVISLNRTSPDKAVTPAVVHTARVLLALRGYAATDARTGQQMQNPQPGAAGLAGAGSALPRALGLAGQTAGGAEGEAVSPGVLPSASPASGGDKNHPHPPDSPQIAERVAELPHPVNPQAKEPEVSAAKEPEVSAAKEP